MPTLQNITVAGLVADLGLSGHKGLATAISEDALSLNVAITPPAWALLKDGTLFTSALVAANVPAPTVDGSYHLYLYSLEQVTATVPVWTISVDAPSANALRVTDVTVVEGEISSASDYLEGLRDLPLAGSGATTALEVVQMDDNLTLSHAGVFVVVSDAAIIAHKKLTLPFAIDCAGQWIHTMSPNGDSIGTGDILLQGEDQLVGAGCSMQLLSDGVSRWFGMDC